MTDINQALKKAAEEAREELIAEYGESHPIEKLQGIYADWLENAIEVLITECLPKAASRNQHEFSAYTFHRSIANL